MAGSRKFRVSALSRRDLMSLTEEAARISGIPYVMSAYREEAEKILEEQLPFEKEGMSRIRRSRPPVYAEKEAAGCVFFCPFRFDEDHDRNHEVTPREGAW
jgi:hypothetical protein